MQYADDVIHGFLIDRQARISALLELLRDFIVVRLDIDGLNVHPGREDFFHIHIGEFNGGTDQFTLMSVDAALVLRLLHDGDQLLFGVTMILRRLDDLSDQLLPAAQQPVQRREQLYQREQHRIEGYSDSFGMFLGDVLGRHFAKEQNHHCCHQRGNGNAVILKKLDEQHRCQCGSQYIHDIIADQYGGQQRFISFSQLQYLGRPGVSLRSHALHAHQIQRSIRRFRRGKESGTDNQKQ